MTEALLPIVQKINGYLSDYILVALLIAVGLCFDGSATNGNGFL